MGAAVAVGDCGIIYGGEMKGEGIKGFKFHKGWGEGVRQVNEFVGLGATKAVRDEMSLA